jgi:hypothetical protein
MPKCRHCGAEFTASRTGKTVHCPAHRTAESRRTPAKPKGYPAISCIKCGHVHTTLRCDRCGF